MGSLQDAFGSDFERQSWRDNYNGGRAAGDWTGNVNRELDRQRERYGTTISGSSSQYSASEVLANRKRGQKAAASTARGPSTSAPGGSGVGSGAVVTGPATSPPVAPGTPVAPGAPYKPGFSPGRLNWQLPDQFTRAPAIDGITNEPLERIGIGGPQEAPGAFSDVGWVRTQTGYLPVPSRDIKERIEDNLFLEAAWFLRNIAEPALGITQPQRPDFLEPDNSHYDFWSMEWREGAPAVPVVSEQDYGQFIVDSHRVGRR